MLLLSRTGLQPKMFASTVYADCGELLCQLFLKKNILSSLVESTATRGQFSSQSSLSLASKDDSTTLHHKYARRLLREIVRPQNYCYTSVTEEFIRYPDGDTFRSIETMFILDPLFVSRVFQLAIRVNHNLVSKFNYMIIRNKNAFSEVTDKTGHLILDVFSALFHTTGLICSVHITYHRSGSAF